jgi:hypothetical protein
VLLMSAANDQEEICDLVNRTAEYLDSKVRVYGGVLGSLFPALCAELREGFFKE